MYTGVYFCVNVCALLCVCVCLSVLSSFFGLCPLCLRASAVLVLSLSFRISSELLRFTPCVCVEVDLRVYACVCLCSCVCVCVLVFFVPRLFSFSFSPSFAFFSTAAVAVLTLTSSEECDGRPLVRSVWNRATAAPSAPTETALACESDTVREKESVWRVCV